MIDQASGLTDAALEAIAGLERRTVAHDGGRLKLEWDTLRSRSGDQVRDLLWWEDGRLLGFLGIYSFRPAWFELTGMVDPEARRRGVGRKLFEAALPIVHRDRIERLFLIVPRSSAAGHDFAGSLGMTCEHSEHALTLAQRPDEVLRDSRLSMRQADLHDLDVLSGLFLDGFGDGHVNEDRLLSDRSRTLMITWAGETVGTIALNRNGERGAIYGFVVAPGWRGRGIGGQALRSACRELFDEGAAHVDLDVEVNNDRALGLYTAVGFELKATDDYYELSPSQVM